MKCLIPRCLRCYPSILICLMILSSMTPADTLYIRDGSVLKGNIGDGVADDVILTNPYFGDVSVLWEDILYQASDQENMRMESYVISEKLDVLAVLCRSVPERKPDSNTFNMLIPGEVQSITDSNGLDVPFDIRLISDNSLITITYDTLSLDTQTVTVASLQPGKIRPTEEGTLVFPLKYIPNQDTSLQVLVKYPKNLHPSHIQPESFTNFDGLIIWNKQLKRQQQFKPEIHFIP